MSKPPIATPHTEGRIFGADWSITNVATLLRANAARGVWHGTGPADGYTENMNRDYLRRTSAQHLPTSVTLIFMHLKDESWYSSLCFARADEYLPWNGDAAEKWLRALFGAERPRVIGPSALATEESGNQSVRQFTLAKSHG